MCGLAEQGQRRILEIVALNPAITGDLRALVWSNTSVPFVCRKPSYIFPLSPYPPPIGGACLAAGR